MNLHYKLIIVTATLLIIGSAASAQTNSVSIGTTNTNASAVLWLNSPGGNQGLIIPVGARASVATPAKGMIIFDTNQIYAYDGTNWGTVGGSGTGSAYSLSYNATTKVITLNPNTSGTATIDISTTALSGGDLGGTLASPTVTGLQTKALPSLPTTLQYLAYDGTTSTWKFQSPSGSVPTLSNGQILTGNGTTNAATALSGDASLNAGAISVTGIRGKAIPALPASTVFPVQLLSFNGTTNTWEFKDLIGANIMTKTVYDPTGKAADAFDLTKHTGWPANTNTLSYLTNNGTGTLSWSTPSGTLPTAGPNQILTSNNLNTPTWVSTLPGSQVTPNFGSQALTSGTSTTFGAVGYTWPGTQGTNGTVLTNNGSGVLSWATPSLSGTAGGDLTGTYPNPAIAISSGNNLVTAINNAATTTTITDSKLATITTPGKVDGGAITSGIIGGSTSINTTGDLITTGTGSLSVAGTTTFGGIKYLWSTPAALTAGTFLTTDATGKLSWASAATPFTTVDAIPKGSTTGLVASTITDNGTYVGIGTTTPVSKLDVTGDLHLSQLAAPPATTVDKLYNVGGSLFWNGTNVSSGGFTTANYIPRGNGTGMVSSSIQDNGTSLGVGTAPSTSMKLYVSTNTQAYGLYSGALMSGTQTNYGLFGEAQMSTAQNVGVRGEGQGSANPVGVMGNANNATSVATAVQGIIAFGGNASPSNIGVEGNTSITSATSTNYGLKGSSTGTSAKNFGVYGTASSATTNWAGYFDQGNVHIKGGLSVGATDGTYGTAGQVLTSNGSGLAPSWTTVATGSSFSTINTIPKGDGTTLVASNLFDNGSQVSATISNASSYAFGISNGGGAGVSGRQGLNIGATASGTENVFGIALTSNTTSSGYNDAIYAIATGSTGRTRGLAAGAYSGTVTNIGVDSYASGSGSSTNYGAYNHVSGGTSNYGLFNIVTGSASGPTYGVYNSISGTGSYGIYTAGETYNYFSGSVGIGNATPSLALSVNGNAEKVGGGPWSSYSDKRLKKNILDFNDGLTLLSKIHPVKFKYNGLAGYKDDGTEYIGVIAQEIQQIAPYMITTVKKKMHETDASETDLLMYNSNALTYILVNAVKEQQKLIEDQKKQIEELKAQQNQKEIATQSELNQMKAEIANIKKALGMEASAKKK